MPDIVGVSVDTSSANNIIINDPNDSISLNFSLGSNGIAPDAAVVTPILLCHRARQGFVTDIKYDAWAVFLKYSWRYCPVFCTIHNISDVP